MGLDIFVLDMVAMISLDQRRLCNSETFELPIHITQIAPTHPLRGSLLEEYIPATQLHIISSWKLFDWLFGKTLFPVSNILS
jgi:hypothetical protein